MTRTPGLIGWLQTLVHRLGRPTPTPVVPPPAPALASHPHLTRREREVLKLIGSDYTNREIADALGIAPETVKTHIANLRLKLGVATKTGLRQWVLDHPPGD